MILIIKIYFGYLQVRVLQKRFLEKTKNKKCFDNNPSTSRRMNEWLNLADVHIIPQKDEASDLVLPTKLITILASGKPFIITTSPKTQLGKIAEAGILVFHIVILWVSRCGRKIS